MEQAFTWSYFRTLGKEKMIEDTENRVLGQKKNYPSFVNVVLSFRTKCFYLESRSYEADGE